MVHNFYQQPGGEDQVFQAEVKLLRDHGHEVVEYTQTNHDVAKIGKLRLFVRTIFSLSSYREVRRLIRQHRIDVVHVHNFLPLISPSVYYAADAEGIPVVQTLHNYRLSCVNGLYFRDGKICEDCVGWTFPVPAVANKCYRQSRVASFAVACMLWGHRAAGTWTKKVSRYIALTMFQRRKMIRAGLPHDVLGVKPNFLDAAIPLGDQSGGYALYIGRLVEEKGIRDLVEAWTGSNIGLRLIVAGDGPLRELLQNASTDIEWVGQVSHPEALRLMKSANVLVFPSRWYEGFPMTIVEAMAVGTPIVCTSVGAANEIVARIDCGSVQPCISKVTLQTAVQTVSRDALKGRRGRRAFEEELTPRANYPILLENYRAATALRSSR